MPKADDAGAIVPAAVEDHDLSACGQVREVSLEIHLRLLTLSRRGKGHHPEYARADPGGDGFDGSAFASSVPALKDDADFLPLVPDPLLKLDQFHMQLAQMLFIGPELELGLAIPVGTAALAASWCFIEVASLTIVPFSHVVIPFQ